MPLLETICSAVNGRLGVSPSGVRPPLLHGSNVCLVDGVLAVEVRHRDGVHEGSLISQDCCRLHGLAGRRGYFSVSRDAGSSCLLCSGSGRNAEGQEKMERRLGDREEHHERSGGYGGQAVLAAEAVALCFHVLALPRSKGSGMKFRGRGAVPSEQGYGEALSPTSITILQSLPRSAISTGFLSVRPHQQQLRKPHLARVGARTGCGRS